jgi:hypothetical protein
MNRFRSKSVTLRAAQCSHVDSKVGRLDKYALRDFGPFMSAKMAVHTSRQPPCEYAEIVN